MKNRFLLVLAPLVVLAGAASGGESPQPVNRIFLVGDSAGWIDTGLEVRPQDLLTIRAGSQVCFSGGAEESCVRADGWPRATYAESWAGDAAACDDPYPEWNHAAVIAKIDDQPVLVGKQNSIGGHRGRLSLGINDCSFDGDRRNEGQFSVVVVVENPRAHAARSGRELIEAALDAMGGKAIGGVNSLAVRAACTGPGGPFTTEVTSLYPDQTLFKQSSEQGSAEWVRVGDKAWRIDRQTGERASADKMQRMILGHEFHALLLGLDTRFNGHTLPAESEEGDDEASAQADDCLRVEMRDEWGAPAAVCLDPETSLPIRLSLQPGGKRKEPPIHIELESWTEIDGVRYVESFTLRQADDVFTYRYEEIRPNSVDRAVFKAVSEKALKELRRRLKKNEKRGESGTAEETTATQDQG